MTQAQFVRRVVKPVAWVACLIPLSLIVAGIFTGALGSDPIKEITHRTGKTSLILLFVTLSVTPLRRLTRVGALITTRRLFGLFAFFYAALHFSTYLVLDQFFAFGEILEDIGKRPYITVGFTSLVLLTPLALTSTKGWIKRMGGRKWNRLHQLIYVAAAGGVFHYLWLVKADTRTPTIFGLILVGLLSARLVHRKAKRPAPRKEPSPAPAQVEAGVGS